MTKEEILERLKKENVHNLDDLANLIVKKAHKGGDAKGEIANGVIVYNHGFVTS